MRYFMNTYVFIELLYVEFSEILHRLIIIPCLASTKLSTDPASLALLCCHSQGQTWDRKALSPRSAFYRVLKTSL
ncbi:hypothetical protein Ndes2437B_g03936 [Nannochloris sp. 'desiccata']